MIIIFGTKAEFLNRLSGLQPKATNVSRAANFNTFFFLSRTGKFKKINILYHLVLKLGKSTLAYS